MEKRFENIPELPTEQADIAVWYEKMQKEFEEDSKTQDFSISNEWDWDFRCAMGIVELDECLEHAEQINAGDKTAEWKAKQLAQIMTAMERRFDIPMIQNLEWESKNHEVIEAYHKISDMRDF